MRKTLGVIALLIVMMVVALASAGPTSAANPYPGDGRYTSGATSNNVISVCFGHYTTETIYEMRKTILSELEYTWGSIVGFGGDLNFQDNGVCNNDGSELRIVWNWDWTQNGGPLGKMVPSHGSYSTPWSYAVIYLNRDRQVNGWWDWTPYNGTDGGHISALYTIGHEFGHALGLDHSEENTSIMYGSSSAHACGMAVGGLADGWHTRPQRDDVAGFKIVYPWGWTNYGNVRPMCYS